MIISEAQYLTYEQNAINHALASRGQLDKVMWMGSGSAAEGIHSPVNYACTARFDSIEGAGDILLQGDYLPFSDEALDAVILNHCLEQKREYTSFLKEIHRVLSGEGILLITGFNPMRRDARHACPPIMGIRAAEYCRSYRMLRKLIQPIGFASVAKYCYGFSDVVTLEKCCRKCLPGLSLGYTLLLQKRTVKLTPIEREHPARKRVGVDPFLNPVVKPLA